MKKLLLSLLISLCGYVAMADMPINLGIHGGVSSNRIKLRDINLKTESNGGYMVGMFMRLNISSLYIEPSLNYSHKKTLIQGPATGPSESGEDFSLKVNSFDIPIMAGIQVLDLSIAKLRAYLGPVLSIGKVSNLKHLGDIGADKTNWHGKIGVGVDVWKLTFDIDYEKAFKDLGHELKAPRSFNFTLGFKII